MKGFCEASCGEDSQVRYLFISYRPSALALPPPDLGLPFACCCSPLYYKLKGRDCHSFFVCIYPALSTVLGTYIRFLTNVSSLTSLCPILLLSQFSYKCLQGFFFFMIQAVNVLYNVYKHVTGLQLEELLVFSPFGSRYIILIFMESSLHLEGSC